MKLTELPNWSKLTKKEQKRIKKVYGEDMKITSTMLSKRELKKIKKSNV